MPASGKRTASVGGLNRDSVVLDINVCGRDLNVGGLELNVNDLAKFEGAHMQWELNVFLPGRCTSM